MAHIIHGLLETGSHMSENTSQRKLSFAELFVWTLMICLALYLAVFAILLSDDLIFHGSLIHDRIESIAPGLNTPIMHFLRRVYRPLIWLLEVFAGR